MDIRFDGRTAIVTGAGSGIGAAIARELGASGAHVVATDRDGATAAATAAAIAAAGGSAEAAALDVTDAAAVAALCDRVAAARGLHLLVNNAGIGGPLAPTGEYPPDGWRQVMAVNLDGVFFGMRHAIPHMVAAGGGAIVNVASILGSVGFAGAPAYTAAKHALLGLTRTAALDHAGQGIRVNAVGPAFIDTPLLDNLPADAKAGIIALHPAGRLGRPDEVAALTVFLLSDRAGFITGSYHLIDGGYCAR